MKTLLSAVLILTFVIGTYADDKYEKAVKKNLERMDTCKTAADYINVANAFERIALAESNVFIYISLN